MGERMGVRVGELLKVGAKVGELEVGLNDGDVVGLLLKDHPLTTTSAMLKSPKTFL